MKRRYSTILRSVVCLALVASVAWAEGKEEFVTPEEGVQANCDLSGYKSEVATLQLTVPDNNANGVTTPPIVVPADGSTIADVIIDMRMSHTWVGDLVVDVLYDETCDGAIDATSRIICRPRGTAAIFATPCGTGTGFGASSDLLPANLLNFDDTAAAPIAEGAAPATIAAGCYKPSTSGSALGTFRGRLKGGCWYMSISDRAAGDLGVLSQWSVHIKNQTVGVEPTTWSTAKTLYN